LRLAIVLLYMGGAAAMAGPPKAASRPATSPSIVPSVRLPIPTQADQDKSLRLVHQVFAADYADRSVVARKALGRKLLNLGLHTNDEPVDRFVLLRESADLSAGVADLSTAWRTIEALADEYEVSRLTLRRSVLRIAQPIAQGVELEALSRAALRCIDLAVMEDQYDDAVELASMAESAAGRCRNLPLVKEIQQRQKELLFLRNRYQEVQPILARLAQGSDDPAGRTEAGIFLCAVKGEWHRGLPMLAGGSDNANRSAAEAELTNPADATAQMRVGHGWWDLAPDGPWLIRRNYRLHAADWYRKSRSGLSGFSLSLVEKRLAEMDAEEVHLRDLRQGLMAELFADDGFGKGVKIRVDGQIDFDFGTQSPDPLLSRDHFSIRWTGLLHPPAAGNYTFVLVANTGARLRLNDQLLIDAPDLTHTRRGRSVTVYLSEGFHPITVEFWDTTGTAKIKLAWITPINREEQPIPAERLFHEPEQFSQ
jgi:hypothetical protein